MTWDLPTTVEIDGEILEIENGCDYRVVLDCLVIYEDKEIDLVNQHLLAMAIFYKEPQKIKNVPEALKRMLSIISEGDSDNEFVQFKQRGRAPKKRLMCWEKDFKLIAPAVSRVLGYDIRTPGRYVHWWEFSGALREVGQCTWATIISLRRKKAEGKRLEKWEEDIYRQHRADIDLDYIDLTEDEKKWLLSP